MNKQLCFLDMDGCIADFVGSCCAAHGLESPYGQDNNKGIFEMEDCWGMSIHKFWEPLSNFAFWAGMPKTPEADALVMFLVDKFGAENICILTNPSNYDGCISAKKAWMKKHYPSLSKNMLFGSAKQFLAGKDRYLVDDRDKNLEAFSKFGGCSIIVPRLWNSMYHHADFVMQTVESQFDYVEGFFNGR